MTTPNNAGSDRTWVTTLLAAPLLFYGITQLLKMPWIPIAVRSGIYLGAAIVLPLIGLWRISRVLRVSPYLPLARRLYWITALLFAGLVALTFAAIGLHTLKVVVVSSLVVISLPILLALGIGTLHLAKQVNPQGEIDRRQWYMAGAFALLIVVAWGIVIAVLS